MRQPKQINKPSNSGTREELVLPQIKYIVPPPPPQKNNMTSTNTREVPKI